MIDPKVTVYLGAKVAFIEICSAYELLSRLKSCTFRGCQSSIGKIDLRKRKVIKAYSKLCDEDGVILIIEGTESGCAWFPEELEKIEAKRKSQGLMTKVAKL